VTSLDISLDEYAACAYLNLYYHPFWMSVIGPSSVGLFFSLWNLLMGLSVCVVSFDGKVDWILNLT
jgi:hypothetical protein